MPERTEVVAVDFEAQREAMKDLYGPWTEEIYAMEAEIQLKFDRCCEANNPILWPCLPLHFKFD